MVALISQHFRTRLPARILTYVLLGLWSLVSMFPVYWLAVTSFKGEAEINRGPFYLPFVDFAPTLESWSFILADPNENLVWRFVNSAVVGLVSALLTVMIGGLAIYGLTRFRNWTICGMPGSRAIMISILVTRVLPPAVIVLPVYFMALFTGTRDTLAALIVTYTAINLPVAVWLLQPVLGLRATEQEEAAQLDGASHAAIFFGITLPMVAGGAAAVGLLIFMLCWNEYLFAAYLATDHAMTIPTWLIGQLSIKEAQVGGEAEELPRFSAATILSLLPLLAGTLVLQRVVGRVAAPK